MHGRLVASLLLAALLLSNQAAASDRPWAVSVYVGPNSQKFFGAILQDFNLQSRNMIVGVALERKFIHLGADIYVAGELQITQTFAGHSDTTGAAEFGLECDKLFGYARTSLAVFTGPSYALDPDYISIGYKHRTYPSLRTKFLNAVSVEFASGLPFSENWDWTARMYHRSGVFGLYSIGDDDGLAVGLGLKYHF